MTGSAPHLVRERWAQYRWHTRYLTLCYRWADVHGWARSEPPRRLLLCGAGAAATTLAFVRYWRARNPTVCIDVVDRDPMALSRSFAQVKDAGVRFTLCDARALPFRDGCFDLIETDFLLQFLSPEARVDAFSEWGRVLHPTGVVTTRDYVRREGTRLERWADRFRVRTLERALGLPLHPLPAEALRHQLIEAGLVPSLYPLRFLGVGVPLLTAIVARRVVQGDRI